MPSTDARRLSRLWERMSAMYGSRWALDYGPANGTLAAIWSEALAEVGNDAIADGLRACMDRESEHPPSLPEFLRLCGYRPTANRPTAHVEYRPSTPLPGSLYADTPQRQCARLAAELAAQADVELKPTLTKAATPKQRADMVRAYWLSKIAAAGATGQLVVAAIQPQKEAA